MEAIEHEAAVFLERELAAEASRSRAHAREAARHRGVAWSACAPEPLAPRSRQDLIRQARETLEARQTWRETEAGRFVRAITQGQLIAGAAHRLCDQARAAWSRNFATEQAACASAARELEAYALQLLKNARRARRAAPTAPRSGRGADARSATPPAARE